MLITILIPARCPKCDGKNRSTRRQCSTCKGEGRVTLPVQVDRSGLVELIRASATEGDGDA